MPCEERLIDREVPPALVLDEECDLRNEVKQLFEQGDIDA
jgi:hypothetical protein